jgi:hypothetical protein
MIEDSTKEFYTASSGEGRSTCSRRNHTMARECSCHSGHDNGSTAGAYTVVEHPPPSDSILFERGNKHNPALCKPTSSVRWHNGKASSLASKQ